MKNEYDYLNDVIVDFSKYEEIDLNEKELKRMKKIASKKKVRIARIAAIAACVTLVAAMSQAVFARQLVSRIIKTISTGQNSFTQYDSSNMTANVPEEFKGLFFDSEGNELESYTVGGVIYDAEGSEITDMVAYLNEHLDSDIYEFAYSDSGDYKDHVEFYLDRGYSLLQGEELTKLEAVLDFTPLLPAKLPEGYELTAAAYFETDGKYVTLIYTNAEGKELLIMERLLNEETAYHMGTDAPIEKMKINGNTAVLIDGCSIEWEAGNVSVDINGLDNITRDELITMAKSVK